MPDAWTNEAVKQTICGLEIASSSTSKKCQWTVLLE
jgi:hypothetical protein